MAQISINNLTFGYEGSFDYVFENVSFSIDTNWKLGFIGRNGKGKTTFLNLLLGKYQYTGSISASTKFDYFPYEIAEYQKQRPVAEFIEDLKPGCEIWRVICELEELSESSEILYRPYCTLSPGERTKNAVSLSITHFPAFLICMLSQYNTKRIRARYNVLILYQILIIVLLCSKCQLFPEDTLSSSCLLTSSTSTLSLTYSPSLIRYTSIVTVEPAS